MKFLKKNKPLLIAICIELFLLLLCVGDFFLPRFYLELNGAEISSTGLFQNGSWHVDQETGEAGYFAFTDLISLPRGVFLASVDYSCTDTGSTIACSGRDTTVNSIIQDNVNLTPEKNNITFRFWTNRQLEDFRLSIIYGGSGSLEVHRIYIAETYEGSTRLFLLVGFLSLLFNLGYILFNYYRNNFISNGTITKCFLLILIPLFASAPLFAGYLLEGHDLVFHLMRIEGIKDGLLSGQFPVKLQPTPMNGYGYATSVFYGDAFLYIPAILRIMGITLQSAYMIYVVIIHCATTLVTYYSVKQLLKSDSAALLGTALYVLSPYRLINIYARAAVGEYTAMLFLPLLALGLYRIFHDSPKERGYAKNWILPTIAFTGIIESHLLSCEMVGFFTILICLIFFRKTFQKERFFVLCKIVIATILVNLGFLVPLADYMLRKNCLISHGIMTSHGIQQSSLTLARFSSIFLNGNGTAHARIAFRQYGMQKELGISVGIGLILCFLLFLYFMVIKEKKQTANYKFGKLMWFLSLGILFSISEYFPWDTIDNLIPSLIQSLQFPWRLFSIGSLTLALVACCCLEFIRANYKESYCTIFAISLAGLILLTSGYLMDTMLYERPPFYAYTEYALPMNTSGSNFDEYAPAGYEQENTLTGNWERSSEQLFLENYSKKFTTISGTLTNESDCTQVVTLPLFYYPGYHVTSTTEGLLCSPGSGDLIELQVPAGFSGEFQVKFTQPLLWVLCQWISFLSICGIFLYGIRRKK